MHLHPRMFQIWEKKHLNTRMLTSTFTFEGKCVSERKRGFVSVTPLTPLNPVLIIKRLTRPLSSSCFFFFLLTLNFLSYHHNYHGHNRHIHYHDHDFLHHRHTHCLPSQTYTAPLLMCNESMMNTKAVISIVVIVIVIVIVIISQPVPRFHK